MDRSECMRGLEKNAELISRAGFLASVTPSGELLSMFTVEDTRLFYIFTATCQDDHVEVYAAIRGLGDELQALPPEARAKILEKILEIPLTYKLSVALQDGTLILHAYDSRQPTLESIGSAYAATVRIAGWLAEQLEKARRGQRLEPPPAAE